MEKLLFRAIGIADPAHFLHFRRLRAALDLWEPFQPKRILDAGCGRGDYTFYLASRYANAQLLGVDLDPALIERNQQTARRMGLTNVRFEIADLAKARFPDPFDLIVSIDVLEHIVAQGDALRNLASSLAPSGRAFLHIPTIRRIPVPFSRFLGGFRAWAEHEHVADDLTAEQFVAAVKNAGFTVQDWRPTFGYLAGELATSVFAIPYANTPVNRALQAMLALPCRVLAMADSLPLPGPRYAVEVLATRS